jgi:hypothetical protein
MKIESLSILSVIMFGLSALSFFIMRAYESHIAGWSAVVFGFAAIITMIISGLRKLKVGKIAKSQN